MKLRTVAPEEATPREQFDAAVSEFRTLKAKASGLREAAHEADEEVKAARKRVAEALTSLVGVSFEAGWSGDSLEFK